MHGAAAAKTLLLKASQLHPVAINALFALCVLGLRHSDMNLVTASLQEMEKYQGVNPLMNLDQHLPDITSLRQVALSENGRTLNLSFLFIKIEIAPLPYQYYVRIIDRVGTLRALRAEIVTWTLFVHNPRGLLKELPILSKRLSR